MLELLNEVPEIKKLMDQKLNQLEKEAKKQAREEWRKEGKIMDYIKLIVDSLNNSFGQLNAEKMRC